MLNIRVKNSACLTLLHYILAHFSLRLPLRFPCQQYYPQQHCRTVRRLEVYCRPLYPVHLPTPRCPTCRRLLRGAVDAKRRYPLRPPTTSRRRQRRRQPAPQSNWRWSWTICRQNIADQFRIGMFRWKWEAVCLAMQQW